MDLLNDDIIKELVLLLDINAIKNFSLINRRIYSLSGNNDIWINKFQQDKLPMIISGNNKIKNWIKEYNNVKVATQKLKELNERVIKDNNTLIILYMDFSYDDNITELLEPSFQKQISSGMKLIDVCNYTNETIYIDITNKNVKHIENFSYSIRYKFFNFYAYANKKEHEDNADDENFVISIIDREDGNNEDEDEDEEDDGDDGDDEDDEDDEDDGDDDGCYEKCDDYEFYKDEGSDILHCESLSNKNIVDKLIFDVFYYYPTNNFTYHISQQ